MSFKKQVREAVIELQRNADQERSDDEHEERPLLEQAQGIEPQHIAQRRSSCRRSEDGVFGRRQAKDAQDQADETAATLQGRIDSRFPAVMQCRSKQPPAGDPADRPQHADPRKLLFRTGHRAERQRVGQCQRRHVADEVEQHQRIERRELGHLGDGIQQTRPNEMQHRQNLLRGKEPIGDHSHEERRNNRPQGRRAIHQADSLP